MILRKCKGCGAVLQDLDEAKDTITKRLEYIAKQMSDRESRMQTLSLEAASHQKIVCYMCHTYMLHTLMSSYGMLLCFNVFRFVRCKLS